MQPTRLWFMRHGEVEEHLVGSFVGTTDVNLSALGRHQAEAIAKYLEDAPIDAILCSPRKRALDTVAPLARAKGMKLDIRKGFAEMDFGQWESKFWHDIQGTWPDESRAWALDPGKVACPGGESCNVFAARIHAALDPVLEEFRGRTIALGGHAGTNRAVLAHVLKRPYMDCFAFAQDYGCVNAVAWGGSPYMEGDAGQVVLMNFVPGPRAKSQGD